MKNFIKTFCLVTACCFSQILSAQTQIGTDIDGEVAGDQAGVSVSMPDAQTVAIGSNTHDGNGTNAGHVRIFEWTGSLWQQKGANIAGEAAGDFSGTAVSMPDPQTVAIGAFGNDAGGSDAGHVRVYEWINNAWQQKGADIDGDDRRSWFGFAVSMPDAQTVGVGALLSNVNGNESGKVQVYEWTGSVWQQKGTDIIGEAAGDQAGISVSMPDAQTIAVGAHRNGGNGFQAGHVRIYEWDGTAWQQKGADIGGEAVRDEFGTSVSMPDAQTVAIGAPVSNGGGTASGQVQVYEWDGTFWQQKGADIFGDVLTSSGVSVSMPDAQTVAIGADSDDTNGMNAGHVRIYQWTGSAWQQKGIDIDGEALRDQSGRSISMPDAQTVAIGAANNDGNGDVSGHVRVYSLAGISSISSSAIGHSTAYPNPTNGQLSIDMGSTYPEVSVVVRNVMGQEVLNQDYRATQQIDLILEHAPGIYFVEVSTGDERKVFEILKKE
ncbi:MAG: T9SS type A sorting domain-containing protein [Bacteroidota bacterium]